MGKFYYIYCKKLKKRVPHLITKGYAQNLITGEIFKFEEEKNDN